MALVLTRRIGESVVINHNITITVSNIEGCKVRLCFNGPKEIAINRLEVEEKLKDNKPSPQ